VNDPNGFPMSQARRTARWWRFAAMPRSNTNPANDGSHSVDSIEFYDTSGNRIGFTAYNYLDTVTSQPDFMCTSVNRVDFIQASNAATGLGGFNGLCNLGGVTGDTITLSGGAKFLGFQVRPAQADGNPIISSNTFNGSGFVNSDVGRFLKVNSGANSGSIYRIITVASATQVTLATPAGNTVLFGATETLIQYTLHEGFNVGTTGMDYFNFGAANSGLEYSIKSVNDALDTLILNEPQYTTLSNQTWEIRRRASQTSSVALEPAKSARIVVSTGTTGTYPQQTGDVACDSRGFLRFFANDVGSGTQRTDGAITAGQSTITGSGFCQDDVGRILQISSTNGKGAYRISAFTSSTQVTLVNAFTGAPVSWVPTASGLTYKVWGERRFRASRYTTCVRS